ncbi:type II secretion system F family protein [Clostridium sp. MSJ-8]|uniref:type II secretion system F family protein n=1 Tax=Clostridium sp. MSJ-8 TaxID=2841510 RepID=UPI001C0E92C7|nr:type II secretion system F family protein [Clostridium sp. MSJ-8]MBU5488052.1 type II secretion system F family protein [Clostridium sp. MSJ-8]
MKKYKYRAMKADGKKIEDEFEAESRDEVVSMITSSGYYPLKIEEVKTSTTIAEFNFTQKITAKDLTIFCRQMNTMLDAGISITNCLSMLSTQVTNKKLRGIITEIEDDVKRGEMLSHSMAKYPDTFPKLLISMVESGEASGNLDEMMLRMAIHFEKESKINSKIKSAMIYPIILSIIATVAVIVILMFVMPTFQEMFEDSNTPLPGITSFLISLSTFMKKYIIYLVIGITVVVVLIMRFKKTTKGYEFFSKLKFKLPVFGDLTKKTVTSRFTRTMSTLLSSGISMMEAIPIVKSILNNKVAEDAMDGIRDKVMKGDGLSGPVRESGVFPDMLASMIRVGEEAGSLDEMLEKTADYYDEEVDVAISNATSMIEPIMIIIMGVVIGGMVVAIMLPMFDMYNAV